MQSGKRSRAGVILLGIGAVCLLLRIMTKGPGWTLGAVVFLLIGALANKNGKKRNTKLQEPLVQEAVAAVFPAANYVAESGIGYEEARNAAIAVAGGYDAVTSSDGVRGTYRGVPFTLATVRLGRRERERDEQTGLDYERELPVFCGSWLMLRTEPLPGTVRLSTRTSLDRVIRTGRKTGNEEFDKMFVTACESEETMRRVLTEAMCQRLLAAQKCLGACYVTMLSEGVVHVASDTGHGLFDTAGDDPVQLREAYTETLMRARHVMDALQLAGRQEGGSEA